MSKLMFDWKDEDPGSLIILVLSLTILLFMPWHSCTSSAPLTGEAPTQAQISNMSPGAP